MLSTVRLVELETEQTKVLSWVWLRKYWVYLV